MKRIKIAALKDQLSKHLRAVEQGGEIVVTDRHRPIARIVPAATAEPTLEVIGATRPFAALRSKRYRRARWSAGSLQLLREERGER